MISEYTKFLEAEYLNRKFSLYEKVCNIFDVGFPLPKRLEERYKNEINFCHLRVTPSGVFSTALILSIVSFILLSSTFYILHIFSNIIAMFLMLITLCSVFFYYLFSYTNSLTKYFRSKAAAEMSLAITYMSISLKINANLESAVAFAAQNLSGPLGLDLKKILWDLETGSLLSVISGLDELSEKWKSENEEFVDAISLLKTIMNQTPDMVDKNIGEAVDLMGSGTKTRMKKYAMSMRNPLTILNAFGILLPILGLIFFPILVIFIPEISEPSLLGFSYDVLLPIVVYIFISK